MDHPMDEPFDELMGRNPKKNLQTKDLYSSSIVTPDPSPSYTSSSTAPTYTASSNASRGSSAPPSNAFVHTSSQDRWAQYERDGRKLKEESDEAYATAVASAAERAAKREVYRSPPKDEVMVLDMPKDETAPSDVQFRRYDRKDIDDRLDRAGSSLPPPEPRRSTARTESGASPSQILKSLSRAASTTNRSSRYEEEDVTFDDPHDQVRAEALKVLEMADEKTHRSDASTSGSQRRVPKALSGLDFSTTSSVSSASRKPYRDDRFAIDDNDEDLVDVVEAERNSSGRTFDMEDDSSASKRSSWSSRYGNPLNSHLTALTGGNRSSGASTTSSVLDAYDKAHHRESQSSRNMSFNSPRSTSSSSPSSTGVFGSGFSFRKNKPDATTPSQYNLQNHRTVWMDVDTNTSNGRSLPPPAPSRSWHENIEKKRVRRRRAVIAVILVCILAIIIGASVGAKNRKKDGSSDNGFSMTGDGVGQSITFYATADVPFDAEDAQKLEGDMAVIPGDADFIVHLGNIQDASVTLCNQAVYEDTSLVLEDSPVPVFILPGQEDWNNCPNPQEGWQNWMNNFEEFESNFQNHFTTDRQLGRTENFSFVHRGVLFIGLHLLGGRIHDDEEWRLRHEENVQWVEEKLTENPDSYRSVVILGNARPSQQQHEFFREAVREIKDMGRPTIYIHADGGGGFEEHNPFPDADNFRAVQLDHGGKSPPLRITVGFGGNPFLLGQPSTTNGKA